MARDYRLVLRDRAFLLPPDMRDWLPEDHFWAWFVLDIVNALEVCAFEATPTPFCNRLHRQENKQQIGKHGALSPRLTTCNKTARHNLARLCVCHACHQVGLLSCGYNHTTIATTNPHQIPKPSSTRWATRAIKRNRKPRRKETFIAMLLAAETVNVARKHQRRA